MANPAVSGTSFANVKGLIDMYGEEKAWEYFKKLNDNVKFYGKRGKDPQEKTVAGEFGIGIIPIDKSAFDVAEKNNLTAIYPEDGLCWVPEGVAIFKNSPNLEVAKAFEDFILRPENQQLIAELDGKDGAQMVIEGTKGYDLGLPKDKFIKEDIKSFGSQRDDILKKWAEKISPPSIFFKVKLLASGRSSSRAWSSIAFFNICSSSSILESIAFSFFSKFFFLFESLSSLMFLSYESFVISNSISEPFIATESAV